MPVVWTFRNATHSLMLDNFAAFLEFPLLNHVGVGLHAIDSESLGEPVRDQGVGMQTGQSDELPAFVDQGQLGTMRCGKLTLTRNQAWQASRHIPSYPGHLVQQPAS